MKAKLSTMNEISRQKLVKILQSIPGKKDLIIDPKAIKPLESVIGTSILKSLDVEKIYKLQNSDISCQGGKRVFLMFADVILTKYICDHISACVSEAGKPIPEFHLILIPRKLFVVSQLLEEEGVFEYVTLHVYTWEIIPLDQSSVFSLEFPDVFKSLFVCGDQSILPALAKSLWSTFTILGEPSLTFAIGRYSGIVCDFLPVLYEELGKPVEASDLNYCFVVDRDADFLSPLLTPSTYTGLLDEVFAIKSGYVEIHKGLVIPLNSSNEIYAQIKNRHFSDVLAFLKAKARSIAEEFEKSRSMQLTEIKKYVSRQLQAATDTKKALSYHISASEMIVKVMSDRFEKFQSAERDILQMASKRDSIAFIEDRMALGDDKYAIMRLICLLSVSYGSLPSDEANSLKTRFLHTYGFEYAPAFHNLEKCGLLTIVQPPSETLSSLAARVAQAVPLSGKKTPLQNAAQKLKLIPSGDTCGGGQDLNYIFSGSYVPLACQLVKAFVKNEITAEDIPKMLPNVKTYGGKRTSAKKSFLVYFIGGVTYAETAAFQLLEKLTGCQIIVAASNMVNGEKMCESVS